MMVDFHDRRRGPVTDVLAGLYDDGRRYSVTTGNDGVQTTGASGYLTQGGNDQSIRVTKSTRSKAAVDVDHASILKIENARKGKDGAHPVLYERPAHRQSGYGRT